MGESLTTQTAERIRKMIVLDELRPGERLRERGLADELNVSRTPLREALKLLETEGLVKISKNRGATVAEFSQSDIAEKLKVLAALERLAGELACQHAKDEDIHEISALHYEMLAAFSRSDRKAYFESNQAIHLAVVRSTGNKALVETHALLNNQLYRVRYLSNIHNELWPSAIQEHKHILEALVARDGEKLGAILFDHLGSTWFKFDEIKDDPRIAPIGADEISTQ